MDELPARITSGYWRQRLDLNASAALDHQWAMLEQSLCIDNFRIAAGEKEGFREGFFFADSDAYKWLDAASRTLGERPAPGLGPRVDAFVALLERAQAADGYLYTYNQIHFPDSRWENLQIEHEHYCLGHLIEAGIAHFESTGSRRLLALARRAADLLVREFMDAGPLQTDGHEEIEIALLRLGQVTGEDSYRELARRLLERRGRIRFYPLVFLRQSGRTLRRMKLRDQMRAEYQKTHPEHVAPRFSSRALRRVPPLMQLRLLISLLSGKYNQQDRPARSRTVPTGHAVRFTYLETALAMLARAEGDAALLATLARAWEHMVTKRMYVTGGIGSLPLIEGFGRDYELHPEIAYAETCAAIGSMLWSWQMLLATGQARYADLFEWQLYNAASVSMALDGRSYFYDNPLQSHGGLSRQAWYDVPCCPSNLSRIWASLGRQVFTQDERGLWIQQYISSRLEWDGGALTLESGLPWDGSVRIRVESGRLNGLHLRVPSWTDGVTFRVDTSTLKVGQEMPTACGYQPDRSYYMHIPPPLQAGETLDIQFPMPVRVYRQEGRIPVVGGQIAIGRGPLLYCLESVDNPGLDIFSVALNPATLKPVPSDQLGGCVLLQGTTAEGKPVTLIPYLLWANRGPSQMNVFLREAT